MQDLETLDFYIMIENFKESPDEFKDYDSELLLKIINKTSVEVNKTDDKELFVDENWKINSKNMENEIYSDNSNLKRILSDIFPNKKIVIRIKMMVLRQFYYPNVLNIKIFFFNL